MLIKASKRLLSSMTNKYNWLSFFAGFSLVLAYAPFSLWWLTLVVPAMWFKIINQRSIKSATKHGFIFGCGWFASGISWVHVSIDQFGGLPLFVSLSLMVLLCLYLALFPALACYLSAKFSGNKKFNVWLLPSFWLVAEYCRSEFLTGFPWLSLGYSQIDGPLAVFAPVVGEIGVTFIVLIINVALFHLMSRNKIKHHSMVLLAIFILGLIFANISWVTPNGKIVKTAIIQANIKQEMKWLPEQEWPTMLKFLDLSRVNFDADLIIWPESAVPSFEPAVQDYLESVNKSAALNDSAIITGILNYNLESKDYFNSLIVLGKKYKDDQEGNYFYNHSNRYYKNHLLPIGEFVPFGELLRPIAPFFNLPMSSFSRGNYIQPNLIANDLHILPLICFEIAFPKQLAANITEETDLILTVSNDAWFGNSHGPHQHLEIARMRALEFGRPVLRSTNNGITAITDHQGNISAQIPQFVEAVLKAEVKLVTGRTPYSRFGGLFNWLLPILLLIVNLFFYQYKK